MKKVISFPHLGSYYVPVETLLKLVFSDHIVKPAPKITKKTLELGSKYSPDYVCAPFKYNLGNFIEALENGANVLIQAGGGCRYGYFAEIQELILRDLGYEFEFIRISGSNLGPVGLYKLCKRIGTSLSFHRLMAYLLLTAKMVRIIDIFEAKVRENIGFEVVKNSFENLHKAFLEELKTVKKFKDLNHINKKYTDKLNKLDVCKPENCLKVGLVGELYSLMEPFSNYFIEKELAKNNIQVSRFITATFLIFQKTRFEKKILKSAGKYLTYTIGADGTDSVERSKVLAEKGYDGIIHLKPFGCMPEVNAMPILQNISKDYKIPILYFSFDSQTSETGVKTRLEAFYDMLAMRKELKI